MIESRGIGRRGLDGTNLAPERNRALSPRAVAAGALAIVVAVEEDLAGEVPGAGRG